MLLCRNHCRCSLLAHPAYGGDYFCWLMYRFNGSAQPQLAALLITVGFKNEGHRKLHTLWQMPAPGRWQSVDNWTIMSKLLAWSRGSAVDSRPTATDYYEQLVLSWNRKRWRFRLHVSTSSVHRWFINIALPQSGWSMNIASPQRRWDK